MLRITGCALAALAIAPVLICSTISPPACAAPAAAVGETAQCARELAFVDRSFAEAMRDLQRNAQTDARCISWKRQIEVMRKASDVFARCTVDDGRATAMSQMAGSIADFRAMIVEAKCQ